MALLRALAAGNGAALTMEYAAAGDPGRLWRPQTFWSTQSAAWAALAPRLVAAVHTDLPQRSSSTPSMAACLAADHAALLPALHLQAVAAHERSEDQLRGRLAACGGAAGLLLVSGSDRMRGRPSQVPAMLALAAEMREAGQIGSESALLVTANPLREGWDALAPKLAAGAQGVVTQPALLRRRFDAWMAGAGPLLSGAGAPLCVGIATPCTPAEVLLWLRLVDVPETDADAEALLRQWYAAEAAGRLAQHAEAVARGAMEHARGLGQGRHLMPITVAGYALAAQLHDAA